MTTWPTATSPSDEKCLADVRQYGWHVVKILETGDTPPWCFTVGLHRSFGHPEIITFGLPLDTGHAVLNIAGQAAKTGRRFTTGTPYDDFLDGYPCELRTVDPVWYRWFVGYAMWFYGGEPFPLLQLFWPDRHGTFPWAAAPDHWLRSQQPLLYEADEVAAGAGPVLDTLR
jgi:hypothetical protein